MPGNLSQLLLQFRLLGFRHRAGVQTLAEKAGQRVGPFRVTPDQPGGSPFEQRLVRNEPGRDLFSLQSASVHLIEGDEGSPARGRSRRLQASRRGLRVRQLNEGKRQRMFQYPIRR